MYSWLWRAIPGPWPVKAIVMLGLFAVATWALFTYVFPYVNDEFFVSVVE